MLNNREWALLVWLTVGIVWILSRRDLRRLLVPIIKLLISPKIALPLLLLVIYVGLICAGAAQVSLWDASLLKDTTFWFIGPGLTLYFTAHTAARAGFFRQATIRTIEVAVFIGFFVNLFVFSFALELVLQAALFVVAASAAVASTDPKLLPAKKFLDGVMALAGVTLLIFVATELLTRWHDLDARGELLALALPVWLTLAALPFIYVLALFATYEQAFIRMDFATETRRASRQAKLAVLITIHLRLRLLTAFTYPWIRDVARSASFWEACLRDAAILRARERG